MQHNYPEKDWQWFNREASSAIYDALDSTRWRTALRIHEIVQKNQPEISRNPNITDYKRFINLLFIFVHCGHIMSSRVSQVMGTGERFEEWENEPILFADVISHNTIDTQKWMLAEKFHKAYYERWLPFPQAIATINNLSYSYIETWKQWMIKEWFAQEEIFYKLPFWSYDAVREDWPLLPATVD